MKILIRICQLLVAVLFIISGLVKANDPLGLSYKMQEFFELWRNSFLSGRGIINHFFISNLDFLHAHSLFLSIVIITLEVITGISLITGWRKHFILKLLLLLIIFFSFLTGYAYLSGKFTNCGCFGDCFPITPLSSFIKDLLLLALIVFLIIGRRHMYRLENRGTIAIILLVSLVAILGIQWIVLNYLPFADCLPFKKGNNIVEQMKPPPNAVPDSFVIKFVYEKGGKQFEFSPENLPADFTTYKFIERKQQLIRKGNDDPAIKGFVLTGSSGTDSTSQLLQLPVCYLLFLMDFKNDRSWINDFKRLVSVCDNKKIPVYIISSDINAVSQGLAKKEIWKPVFSLDFTVIRTASRTTPELYLLHNGKIFNKYSGHTIRQAIKDIEISE